MPNVIVAPSFRLIYIILPKCACTTIKAHLCNLDPNIPLAIDGDAKNLRGTFRAVTRQVSMRTLHNRFQGYTIFTFLRDPMDRLVSLYRDKVARDLYPAYKKYGLTAGMPFCRFVESICAIPDSKADDHFRSQYSMITYNSELLPNFIGTVENLDHGLSFFLSQFQPHNNENRMFHFNRKHSIGGEIMATEDLKATVRERYAADYKLHASILATPSGQKEFGASNRNPTGAGRNGLMNTLFRFDRRLSLRAISNRLRR